MKPVVAVVLLAMTGASALAAQPPQEFVGTWQFSTKEVWIDIHADGTAFQCRIAPLGSVFNAKGSFVPPHSIRWESNFWGTDSLELADGYLVTSGKTGTHSLHPARQPLDPRCHNKSDM
ncbi:hypothetical protein [Dyella sp.]|uniref:hypothetical protein n=1 Tax=Dyella sp. TaxID=1869338 RepID=UPI002ED0ACC2